MKKCLILCNGPSLADVDNSTLEAVTTFGSNRVYLKYTPDFYACVNPLVIEQYHEEIAKLHGIKHIRAEYAYKILGAWPVNSRSGGGWSYDPLAYVYEGWTVTYVLMQLAHWYGFEKIGIVGMDHKYKYHGVPNEELIANGKDCNHFDSRYFTDGVKWNAPDLEKSELHYQKAKDIYEKSGREIINLTPDSACDVFKKGNLEEWML